MTRINISYMAYDAIETLRNNASLVSEYLKNHSEDSSWLNEVYSDKIFEEKKFKINEFSLETNADGDYSKVDYENSIRIYENLSCLPRYVLTDEGFWAWFNFTIGYKASLQAMRIGEKGSTFRDHWLFTQGRRRGIFFGVMSRCYFRVELTIDETLDDKYELTKFVIANPERFRNLTWRANSNEKHIVLGVLKAEKDIVEKYGDMVKNSYYPEMAKYISLQGSVKLLDSFALEEIYQISYDFLEGLIKKDIEIKR